LGSQHLKKLKKLLSAIFQTASDKVSKSKHIKDTPPNQIVNPHEHTEEEIKKRKIVKAKRIPVQDEEEEKINTTKPKKGRKRKVRKS
jgi:hypothetical protein